MSPLPHLREGGQVRRLDYLDGELDAALLREMWLHGWQKMLVLQVTQPGSMLWMGESTNTHAGPLRYSFLASYAYPEVEEVEHRGRIEQAAARQELDHHPWKTVECGSKHTEQREEGHVAQKEGTERERQERSAGYHNVDRRTQNARPS
jgi:hypothetical protein